jgi:hypothetical protein
MAIVFTSVITSVDSATELGDLATIVTVTGLAPGTKYDIHRLVMRRRGTDDGDEGVEWVYERQLPDKPVYWSAVAHRVGWTAPTANITFKDYEGPLSPFKYFIVATSLVGPSEFDFTGGNYPVSRGVLSSQVVDFGDASATLAGCQVMLRSTMEVGLYAFAKVFDLDLLFHARGTQHPVMGKQYPVFISDTREARAGTLVLATNDVETCDEVRRIVFPVTGQIRPFWINSGSEALGLIDNMAALPLDVRVEQATHADAGLRFVSVDFIEADPTTALVPRGGDDDTQIDYPVAQFTIAPTPTTPGHYLAYDWLTLTDTSTGLYDTIEWNCPGALYGIKGSGSVHHVKYARTGIRQIRLRVYGSGAGADTRVKNIHVYPSMR